MLVISRKKGESVLIGDDIEVTVIKVEEGVAKIAISAPKEVGIWRQELYLEVKEENKKAMDVDLSTLRMFKK